MHQLELGNFGPSSSHEVNGSFLIAGDAREPVADSHGRNPQCSGNHNSISFGSGRRSNWSFLGSVVARKFWGKQREAPVRDG